MIQVCLLLTQISLDKWNEFPSILQGCMCVCCVFLSADEQFNHKYWRMFFYIPEYLGSGTSCWCGLSTHDTSQVNIWKHKKQELKGRRCVCCLLISYGFLDVFLLSLGVKGHVVWWWRVRPQIKKPSFKSWLPLSSCVMLRKSCNFKGSQLPHLLTWGKNGTYIIGLWRKVHHFWPM